MKGDRVVEGKRWWAVYITPKIVKSVISWAGLACSILLCVFMVSIYNNVSIDMDAAIAEGSVPKIVRDYALACMGLFIGPIMIIIWRLRR